MQKSDQIDQLAAALSAFQAAIEAIGKNAQGYGYKYADLTSVWNYIRGPLADAGLSIVQCNSQAVPTNDCQIVADKKGNGFSGTVFGVIVETMVIHTSGQWISDECYVPMAYVDPQGAGAAITYARRYGLSSVLGLVTDEDDDGMGGRKPDGAKKTNAAPQSGAKNNAPMDKALEESKPVDAAKEMEEIWGHGAAHAKQSEILTICRDLAANGDTTLTGHKKLADYVLERFDEPLAKLSVKSVNILIEELTERLDERKAVATEPASDNTPTHSVPDPISAQQLTTLERLCDLKNYSHEDCAVEYSEGEVNTLGALTEQQAQTAIKKVQKMAKIEPEKK